MRTGLCIYNFQKGDNKVVDQQAAVRTIVVHIKPSQVFLHQSPKCSFKAVFSNKFLLHALGDLNIYIKKFVSC